MMAGAMQDRRQHDRIPIRAEVQLCQSGRVERMVARDISVGGAFLETTLFDHIELRTGSRCELTLFIEENRPTHAAEDGHTVHTHARIVRRDPGGPGRPPGLGVIFERVDLDNLARLRALVSKNP
jgi:PilZ domain-containing protein